MEVDELVPAHHVHLGHVDGVAPEAVVHLKGCVNGFSKISTFVGKIIDRFQMNKKSKRTETNSRASSAGPPSLPSRSAGPPSLVHIT